jgi:hypothetical protein
MNRLIEALRTKKPMSAASWTALGAAALFAAVSLVGSRSILSIVKSQASYQEGVIRYWTATSPLKPVRAVDAHDPAFDSTGRLLAQVRDSRCAAADAAVNKFDQAWVGATSYNGAPVTDHVLPIMMGATAKISLYAQGCITKPEVDQAIASYRDVEKNDLSGRGWDGVISRYPLAIAHGSIVTLHSLLSQRYGLALAPAAIAEELCIADTTKSGSPLSTAETACAASAKPG